MSDFVTGILVGVCGVLVVSIISGMFMAHAIFACPDDDNDEHEGGV